MPCQVVPCEDQPASQQFPCICVQLNHHPAPSYTNAAAAPLHPKQQTSLHPPLHTPYPYQSWASSSLAYAPKGRLLLRLQQYPWALSALPALLLLLLLPGLLRSRSLHFAGAGVEAQYAAWFNRRHVGRDLMVHGAWLIAAVGMFVQARSGAAAHGAAPWQQKAAGAALDPAALPLLTPLALLGCAAPAAAAAALRRRWYAAHRERVLVGSRLAQMLAALALRALAPARLDGAWPMLALAQISCALLMRVRFSAFLPAQLLHVLVAVCAGGGCATGAGAVLHFSRLLGFGWCAPALLVFALETYSRRSFTHAFLTRGRSSAGQLLPPAPPSAKVL